MSKGQEFPLKVERNSSSSAEWSEHSSSSSFSSHSSYTGSDDSYIPDWEPFVTYDGQLFYLELNPAAQNPAKEQNVVNTLASVRNAFGRVSTRRSARSSGISKLSKLISRRAKLPMPQVPSGENKVTFRETSTGQIKELTLPIDPARRHKFGRRTSVSESLLGIATCPFPDGERVMVAGFSSAQQSVKVGDWIKKIDDQEVTVTNWEAILLAYDTPTDVILTLQQTADEKPIEESLESLTKFFNLSMLANNLGILFPGMVTEEEEEEIFALLYLTMNGDTGPINQDTLFCFPEKEKNSFYATRGSFLTINSLLATDFQAQPQQLPEADSVLQNCVNQKASLSEGANEFRVLSICGCQQNALANLQLHIVQENIAVATRKATWNNVRHFLQQSLRFGHIEATATLLTIRKSIPVAITLIIILLVRIFTRG
uniref:PDZ domain-containing protein n=1 Tax=Phlebotomus papatasi TaxID=29031 RepID=A0A1B0DPZ0_PHLPP